MTKRVVTAEHRRLADHNAHQKNWLLWGPYLSDRAWGTVREDYSAAGKPWEYFTRDQARSRTYRWNEDGLGGISDRHQYLCFAIALWNGQDPILKERLFGLGGNEGNHGEDVKEYYFYLDNTPSHSYMKMLYKYPQGSFPYEELIAENRRRGRDEPEYELIDTGAFAHNRYFDVMVEYAKSGPRDILIQCTLLNQGPDEALCHLLPTLWFRNTWSWGYPAGPMYDIPSKPLLRQIEGPPGASTVFAQHPVAGVYYLYAEQEPQLLFTENETNRERLFGAPNQSPFVKDAFHRYLIGDERAATNPGREGTKTAAWYQDTITPGQAITCRLRLSNKPLERPFHDFDEILGQKAKEADEFYAAIQPPSLNDEAREIQRQALAGLLWTKQLYYYDVPQWLEGDPGQPVPASSRKNGRNAGWKHLNNFDVISMPDKWEYPWYATWDLAFHTVSLALVDPDFAKRQLRLLAREWYMHPNGQVPAYEWAFDDVNPPVHAWAAWRIYQIERQQHGQADRDFLESIFHKLLLNFTWWVNRKDADGNNIFQGGFLGLDNIGVFDRSAALPVEGHLDQADGTAWMAVYCLNMLEIALELAKENDVYQDMATKFFEHFLRVAQAMSASERQGHGLWDDKDGFFYDALHTSDGQVVPMRVRSLVGLLPLFAVVVLEPDTLSTMEDFKRRMNWFLSNRPGLTGNIASVELPGAGEHHLLSILTRERLVRVLQRMLDEEEFLSTYGIRSLSKEYADQPYQFHLGNQPYTIAYEPGESRTGLFGGNSNWRGPIWFSMNYLIIESLRVYYRYYGESLTVECPTGSGIHRTLLEIAQLLSKRLQNLFFRDDSGRRPFYGQQSTFQQDPLWRDLILFFEYFHGETGKGLGASHQTGWTALVANLIQDS
jgi:hypothetical protein